MNKFIKLYFKIRYLPIINFIINIPYWIRTHTYNRYHIINLKKHRSTSIDYKWGWIDKDYALLMVNFIILCDFVEEEKCFKKIDWRWSEGHQHAAKEIKELYRWWRFGRNREWEMMEVLKNHDEIYNAEEALHKRDEEMLIRLIKIRRFLWT